MSVDKTNRKVSSAEEIAGLISVSREAQQSWEALSHRERSRCLKRVGDLLGLRADSLAATISKENGKTLVDALATEILPAAMALPYYCSHAKRVLSSKKIRGGNILMFNKRSRTYARPWGVVGIISPWNYPFAIPFSEIVMALITGNGVILKVASNTLSVGEALESLFLDAGVPPGLFAYVVSPGAQAGAAFIDGGVDKLFFTGSTEVGKTLMALAAPRLLPLVLELGGNDAAIVRSDADLDRAVAGIVWAGFSNAGQSCAGVQRVFVHQSIYDDFCTRLSSAVLKLRLGEGDDWSSDIGAMISLEQKATVESQIAATCEAGARILVSTPLRSDLNAACMAPTVFVDVPESSPLFREEVFGPVLAVAPVASDAEAVRLSNDSSYSLTASVWSQNRSQARRLAKSLKAGAVTLNDHLISHGLSETPWGGFGASGLGRTHGAVGLRDMVRTPVVVDYLFSFSSKAFWWYPYSTRLYLALRSLIDFASARNLFRRLAVIPTLFVRFFRARLFLRVQEKQK